MRRFIHIHHYYYVQEIQMRKQYGLMAFVVDIALVAVTGGLWLIWIFAREMRNR